MPNFTRMLSSKFYYDKISKYRTLKFKNFSRTFKGLDFFSKFKDFQGLLKDPMNPVQSTMWANTTN